MRVARLVVPLAKSVCSTSSTRRPARAHSRAMATPLIPPPMMAISKLEPCKLGRAGREKLIRYIDAGYLGRSFESITTARGQLQNPSCRFPGERRTMAKKREFEPGDGPFQFRVKLEGAANMEVAAMRPPFDVPTVFGTKARVPVRGTVNGFPFRSSLCN